ncbi:MAG: flagellar hook-length control protein FliK [Oceanicoccus sp.]|jgi:flagellar hook-length control protein FliK
MGLIAATTLSMQPLAANKRPADSMASAAASGPSLLAGATVGNTVGNTVDTKVGTTIATTAVDNGYIAVPVNAADPRAVGVNASQAPMIQSAVIAQQTATQNITGSASLQVGAASRQATGAFSTGFERLLATKTVDSKSVTTDIDAEAMNFKSALAQPYRAQPEAGLSAAVMTPVGKPGWSESVVQRVMWMSSQNIHKAEIALDPPELGALQVRINTQADQTTVQFTSPNPAVRDALDQGMPRLREMLEGQGLQLADADVAGQGSQGDSSAETQEGLADEHVAGNQQQEITAGQETSGQVSLSLVDHYV